MKLVRTLDEFVKHNDTDLERILLADFKNFIEKTPLEDLKSYIYLHFLKKRHIESYAPLKITIDPEKGTWHITRADALLSTYLHTVIRYYLIAYHYKDRPDDNHLSYEDYKDDGYRKDEDVKIAKLKFKETKTSNDHLAFDLKSALRELEKKTKNKGNFVCENSLELSIAKEIDKFGSEGCSEKDLINSLFNYAEEDNMSGLDRLLITRKINEIENKKMIKSEVNDNGEKIYFIDQIERRSLYKLFSYYLQGLKDKEISEKFNITVAGIGAMKRNLRKEIKYLMES
jgi:hypothetical protein